MLLDDASARLSPPVDDGSVENIDACMMDVTDNAREIPNRDHAPNPERETYPCVLEAANNIEEKSGQKTADVGADNQLMGGDAAKSDGNSIKSDDSSSEGGAVYMSLCALAVAGACFFYQKLWKS